MNVSISYWCRVWNHIHSYPRIRWIYVSINDDKFVSNAMHWCVTLAHFIMLVSGMWSSISERGYLYNGDPRGHCQNIRRGCPTYNRVKHWSTPFDAAWHNKPQWPWLLRTPMFKSMLVSIDLQLWQGSFILTTISFYSSMDIKLHAQECVMKLLIHCYAVEWKII